MEKNKELKADERLFWMELLTETGIENEKPLRPLMTETNQLVSIFVSIYKKYKN